MRYIKTMMLASMLLALAVGGVQPMQAQAKEKMTVTSAGIIDGRIADVYGSKGTQFGPGGMPTYSLPLKINNAPKGTVSYAIVIDDYDAVPLFGFTWIHWLAANLERDELAANESVQARDFVQGANSWYGKLGGLDAITASVYGGMAPPDGAHTYNIKVYALDTKLPLEKGFFLNQLYREMEGHVLAEATLKGVYSGAVK